MDILLTLVAFLVLIVILVLVHEVGHFAVAKWAGVAVQEFGVGFPPRIASVVFRGTRYSLNWIPLGGFVKLLGEDGEIEVERLRSRGLSGAAIEKVMEGALSRRRIPVRLAVLLAGVLMNFVAGALLFALALSQPTPEYHGPLTVISIQEDSPAEGALEEGDVITGADGRTFDLSTELTAYVRSQAGEPVTIQVMRDGVPIEVEVTPRVLTEEEQRAGTGAVGFGWEADEIVMGPPTADGPIDALAEGTATAARVAAEIPGGLARAIAGMLGLAPPTGDVAGPIGIAQQTGRLLDAPLVSQLFFIGLLSVNLAVLNVLPFPPLDGGRVLIVLIEAIRRRRLSAEREALIYFTGFLVLIALVILISIQDISRLPGS
ncbi:MAG: M50 family metallopeptidase [Candidatus Limnocylindria bacterium]